MPFKVKDHYFKKAKKDKFVARSIYKLEEIDKKFKILKKGDSVIDLGYHPGSWIQYAADKVKVQQVVGIDLRPVSKTLESLANVRLYEKDAFEVTSLSDLEIEGPVDVVLSDMAPNTTGIKSLDQDRSLNLVEKVFEILPIFLKPGGHVVIKVFDGHEAQVYLKNQKKNFEQWDYLRPKSTRSVSKEFFVVGRGYKGDLG